MTDNDARRVREGYAAFARGGVEASLEYYTDDCLFEDFPEMPDRGVYRGKDGIREAVGHFSEVWGDDLVFEPIEVIDAGEDLVVAIVAIKGSGGRSGAPLDAPTGWVYEMRDGKAARVRAFTSKAQAFEAVGLDPQTHRQ